MKFLSLSALAIVLLAGTASAHDIHNRASDHTHPGNLYTHSVSSHVNHHKAHHYNGHKAHRSTKQNYKAAYHYPQTKTATYYTRSYPIKNTYTYYRPANTTIHQPPFAYSSCAGNCQTQPKRILVSSKVGTRDYSYRAPSEYRSHSYIQTPRKGTNGCTANYHRNTTYVSPYKTHKLSTCSSCGHNHSY